ncbi:glucose-6-phosphate dehydrogenase [Prosthecomicrobium hirschii]|uniref:Glucose-6-phosphate 1-dehydrogenase n=1 Tax=Prosthecodimorpha hirschii TaxID=665126 RepID=A0A0P6W3S1_9HYPH|nr:glucose-6-phosphate dehydrogenase [Prosthecomicrobium hirschii]KPL53834.1 glucose-6-phosphate dehydrogenase [Prosthecomicrobium hirschii]MCW1841261.1 glucose-6-phosphate dehydrogenase [Prosthecomicrobium hirschii]TPQ51198.1 glucose-6-phosphate dehydrogenase [Prosthecomicrobium hirschii]
MASRIISVDVFDFVAFGGTGDLVRRKLLPALFQRDRDHQIEGPTRIIGVARADMTRNDYRNFARDAIIDHVDAEDRDQATLDRFIDRLDYVRVDAVGEEGWGRLKALLEPEPDRIRVYYLATGPDLFGGICRRLGEAGLVSPQSRVVVEKPVGKDLKSAQRVNDAVGAVFDEKRIFRIDHYLGKETVQNLMALRFANALFEPIWNSAHIDHVQITVAETLGVEGRGGYYDTAGALRDMVQNHILQLLCLVAMEPPAALDADSVRDEKLKVLKALRPIVDGAVATHTVRGQYDAGASALGPVAAYADEIQNAASQTETFVALKAEVNNWRWSGTPFYLRTGKRLAARCSEILVSFKAIPHSIFDAGAGTIARNELVIRLQPQEGIRLHLMIKDPGPGGMRLRRVPLDMTFAEAFGARNPDAYERLVLDVVRGNQTLFMRRDEVEAAWSWIDPILDGWRHAQDRPKLYRSGTWGPSASIALIERDGRTWHEDAA